MYYGNRNLLVNTDFTVNNRSTKTRWEIFSKETRKTQEPHQWHRSVVFIVNFGYISHLALVFLLLTVKSILTNKLLTFKRPTKVIHRKPQKRNEIWSSQYIAANRLRKLIYGNTMRRYNLGYLLILRIVLH